MTPEQRSDVRSSGSSRTRHLFGRARDPVRHWNATAAERIAQYPCDRYVQSPGERFTRAVGVESPPETVFRWLCQRKVAPYSYDWTGNPGRCSPRSLTPEVERLEPGQEFLVFWLVEFDQNRHKTGVVLPRAERVFGRLAISYVVEPRDAGRCRLVACLSVTAPSSVLESARLTLLAFGDLLMMRKQLNTLKERAGRSARDRSVGERDFLAPGRGLPSRAKGDRVNSPAGGLLRTQRKDARIMPMLARGISHDSRWPTLPLPSGLPRKPF